VVSQDFQTIRAVAERLRDSDDIEVRWLALRAKEMADWLEAYHRPRPLHIAAASGTGPAGAGVPY
jgi:hypothetical protein